MHPQSLSDAQLAQQLKSVFVTLIKGFCANHQLEDVDGILGGKPIELDGVSFSLVHDVQTAPDIIFFYTDFGEIPAERASDVCKALMEMNLSLHHSGGATFGIAPSSGRAVLAEHFPLVIMTPALLGNLLAQGAAHAKAWRSGHFLDANGTLRGDALRRTSRGQAIRHRLHDLLPKATGK